MSVKIFSRAETFKYEPALLLLGVGEGGWNTGCCPFGGAGLA